ncbi:MAG: bifunctional tetrahydrofolate synthase/dihydrofolate synthase [Betaproteobacteria bacterium]|nr:bifunctional tetrahydrofolate synthase/dihydrofolate synthase [Betaproteobacteria bacterium]MCC6247136.1 bifunctional tetrahydrofolate synthase/dihydrofolate synthase [Rubrivivax sp.]
MTAPTTLEAWLAQCERLHTKSGDTDLARVAAVWARLERRFTMPVITVAGTNGKGSTCAMLEAIARQAGYRTGLYTSPHLVRFEERCRVDGVPLPAAALLPHFAAVDAVRGDTPLTWFEFTTLVILSALAEAAPDVVILEIGLGGRLDAVNIIDADCAVIATIDLDHMELLGPDRESIGWEKAHVMRSGRPAVVGDPNPPQRLLDYATAIGADLRLLGRDFHFTGDRQQWNWSGRQQRFAGLAYPALRGANQLFNAAGVLAAFETLRERLPVNAQAVRNGLALVELPGRFQVVPGRPALVLDVAHNPQSVAMLARNLDSMGFYPRTHAVFGAMRDKAIAEFLPAMLPLVDTWYCTGLPTPRAATADELAQQLRAVLSAQEAGGGRVPRDVAVHAHADPGTALRAAVAGADAADRIVVFGSFFTVGGVLKEGLPRLDSPHGAPGEMGATSARR